MPIGNHARARIGIALRRPWLAVAIVGLGFCVMLPRSSSQPLQRGHFAAQIPKNMRLNASTLVRVAIWDKQAEAQARATLEAGPISMTDVRVGRLLRVELVAGRSGKFTVHALTPTNQLLLAGRLALWEWTIIPLQPGEHELSVMATNLASASGQPLNLPVHSVTVNVEVAEPRAQVPKPPKPAQREEKTTAVPVPSRERLEHALGLGASPPDDVETADEINGTRLNARKWKFAAFFNRIKSAVAAEWHPDELISRKDPSGNIYGSSERTTVLQVQLQPDGRISGLKVARSCGADFLDDEVMGAFRRAQPFENPPPGLMGDDGYIRFNFAFVVQNSGHTSLKFYKPSD